MFVFVAAAIVVVVVVVVVVVIVRAGRVGSAGMIAHIAIP